MKIKHIVLGFFGALFVTTLIFQAPILAWAQNTTLWYGSQGGKVWTLASGGTITANSGSAVTLAGTNTISGATTISAPLTITGGITGSNARWTMSGVVNLTGGTKLSGADTLASSTLLINPFMTYAKCGVTAVDADRDTAYIYVPGLLATDAVFAMTAEDTANAVVRAFVGTSNWLTVKVAGNVVSNDNNGMKVSWFAIRPQ